MTFEEMQQLAKEETPVLIKFKNFPEDSFDKFGSVIGWLTLSDDDRFKEQPVDLHVGHGYTIHGLGRNDVENGEVIRKTFGREHIKLEPLRKSCANDVVSSKMPKEIYAVVKNKFGKELRRHSGVIFKLTDDGPFAVSFADGTCSNHLDNELKDVTRETLIAFFEIEHPCGKRVGK